MKRTLDIAYYTGLWSIGLVFAFLAVLAGQDNLAVPRRLEDPIWVSWIAWMLVTVFGVSVLVLWIGGWIYVISNWPKRTPLLNVFCIVFLLLGPVFAGFTFRFLQRRNAHITKSRAHQMQ